MLTACAKTILRLAFSRECLAPNQVKAIEDALRVGALNGQFIEETAEDFLSSGLANASAEIRAAMDSIAENREEAEKYVAAILGLK